MKYLSNFLQEALEPRHIEKIKSWVDGMGGKELAAKKLSDHVFKGKEVLSYPLQETKDVDIHPQVKEHLEKFGYKIPSGTEYHAGYAVDKHNRITSIGKALRKTKADPEVLSAFENDPNRASQGNLNVSYSWEPHHVASMSTGRGWTSCMNMDAGCNRHYLEHDIRHGTHVAYLTHPGDEKIEKPLARIALKPFTNSEGHTILRPENATYGTAKDSFSQHVSSWAEKHFPAELNQVYHKPEDLYNDSESMHARFSKDRVHDAVDSLVSGNIGFGSPSRDVLKHLSSAENVRHVVNHLLENHPTHVGSALDRLESMHGSFHDKISGEDANKVANHYLTTKDSAGQADLAYSVSRLSPKLSNNNINKFVDHLTSPGNKSHVAEPMVVSHAGLSDENLHKFVDTYKDSLMYVPTHRFDRKLIDKAHEKLHGEAQDGYGLFDQMFDSKHFNTEDAKKVMHHEMHIGRLPYSTSNRLIGSKVYTKDLAKELSTQYPDSQMHIMHPDATPADIDDLYASGQEIKQHTVRGMNSHSAIKHAFNVHPERIIKGIRNTFSLPDDIKPHVYLATNESLSPLLDDHREIAKHILTKLTPTSFNFKDPMSSDAKDVVRNAREAMTNLVHDFSNREDFHDHINTAIHNVASSGDPLTAHRMLHIAKVNKVPLKRSVIDRVNASGVEHNYNPFNEDGVKIVNG